MIISLIGLREFPSHRVERLAAAARSSPDVAGLGAHHFLPGVAAKRLPELRQV